MKNTLLGISGLIIILTGAMFLYQTYANKNNGTAGISAKANEYKNVKYGFQVVLPTSWTAYHVTEDAGTAYDRPHTTTLRFGLPLNKKSNGASADGYYYVWSVDVTPVADWKKDECSASQGPCFQGDVLGKSDAYVFEDGIVSPYAGGDCADAQFKNQEQYFCAAYSDIRRIDKDSFTLLRQS